MNEGIESSMLDELVTDVASGIAYDTNNSGMDAQLEYLKEMGVSETMIIDKLGIGDNTELDDRPVDSKAIADKFLECIKSSLSVEINGNFVRVFEEDVLVTSGDPDENILDFYFDFVGEVFVTNAEMSEITYNKDEDAFEVGGYTFKFFELSPAGLQ